jgi:putative transposase
MVANPEDYRWSGYGEAVGGGRRAAMAREGLGRALDEALRDAGFRQDWGRTLERYRVLLYDEGRAVAGDAQRGDRGRRGMAEEEVEAVVAAGGKMTLREALRYRVRYFCDGAVLGSAEFVDGVFEREKAKGRGFGGKRRTGARRMRGADWGGLRVLRDLQKDVMGT